MRFDSKDVRRRAVSFVGLVTCVALIALATACGPLGDDDEEEPTAVPARTGSPAPRGGTPVATPPGATPRANASPPARTPAAADEDTPPARPTGAAAEETAAAESPEVADVVPAPTPPVVEGCEEPAELPEVQGSPERAISAGADEGVNLRAGPGADCDLLAGLLPGTAVTVVSGPVLAGEFEWVKVEVEGTEGWVAAAFLEAVEDEAGA